MSLSFFSFGLKGKLFWLVFARRVQKTKGFASFLGMFAMMNIMRIDHALQITTAAMGTPFQTLVYDDIMKNQIKHPVTKDSQSDGKHKWIVRYLRVVIENGNGRNTEDQGEKIVSFECMVMNGMVRFVPRPKESMHHVLMSKPGYKFPKQKSADNNGTADQEGNEIHVTLTVLYLYRGD
jgi:hypothetical protein